MKWTPEAEAALQDLKRYLSSTPTLVAPKPQEKLLLYIAATNQVVSAALVAEREADDEPATTADASSDKQGASPASSGPAGSCPARSGPDKDGSAQTHKEMQKRMVQCPVYLPVPFCRGLGQGTLVCRSCFSAFSWPRESCAITSKHMRSQLSPAFR